MKKGLLYIFCLIMGASSHAQKLSAETEALARQIMSDPAFSKAMENEDDEIKKNFPLPNKTALSALPATPANEGQMSGYLKKLYTAYKTNLPIGAVDAVQASMKLLGQDGDKLSITSMSSWYNGSQAEATLMALQAGIQKPGDPLILNNLGAMLHMAGASYHALPVLRSLYNRFPENPMILNNIGQAYAGVGQLDTAMKFFGRCIKKSPHHPEANNTAGQIEKFRGNNAKAQTYFENALKGSHHSEALEGLEEIAGDDAENFVPPMNASIDFPYFNEFKYQLPRQCSGPGDAPYIKQEHEDFVKFIEKMAYQYSELGFAERRLGDEMLDQKMEKAQQDIMSALKNRSMPGQLFMPGSQLNMATMRKMKYLPKQMQNESILHIEKMKALEAAYQRLIEEYDKARQAIAEDFEKRSAQYDCGEGRAADCAAIFKLNEERCQKVVSLGNSSQGAISAARIDIQKERTRYLRWVFNIEAYYGYMGGLNEHLANAAFLNAASEYLSKLKVLAYDPIVIAGGNCDDKLTNVASKEESDETKKMNCPIDIDIPFVVGRLALNCEQFSFSGGEGVIFKMSKDFSSGQSTMSISAGLQFEGSKEWGIFSGEVSAAATQSFYITWDKENNISDAGIAFNAEAGIKAGTKLETPGNVGKDYLQEFQKEIGHKAEFGYTMGINSGWTFNDGYLSGVVKSMGNIFK